MIELLVENHPNFLFTPGEKYEYSNTGYNLLASIIERISGQSFRDFLRENLFDKAGMTSSLVCTGKTDEDIYNRVFGYKYKSGTSKLKDSDYDFLNGCVGDGAVYASVEDLFKWDQVLYTDKLVSQATIKEAFTPYTLNKNKGKSDYGFGWNVKVKKGKTIVDHTGSWVGFLTFIKRDLDSQSAVIILNNTTDLPWYVTDLIAKSLDGKSVKIKKKKALPRKLYK